MAIGGQDVMELDLNETLLWLLYSVSGLLAFALVYRWRSRIGLAILACGLLTATGWALLFQLTEEEKRPDWVRLDLSLSLTFGLIFAACGAMLARRLLARRDPAE
jgi:hypothetical protein